MDMLGLDNPIHILMVLVVAFMLFGAKRLPEVGRGLGEGLHGFRRAISGEQPSESLVSAQVAAEPITAPTDATAAAPAANHVG
jgi:sec-independent protein translocase protein TatA